MLIFVLGNAGSGKTTFTRGFYNYLKEEGIDCCTINLDPTYRGVFDFSIANYINFEEEVKYYGLNYGMIKCIEKSLNYIEKISENSKDFYLKVVDTPGQLDIFLYRDVGRKIVEIFRKSDKNICSIFVVDSFDVKIPENFLSIIAYEVIISLKLGIRSLPIINKKDLLNKEEIKEIRDKIIKKKYIFEVLEKGGYYEVIANSLKELYELSFIWRRPIFVSSKEDKKFEEVLSAIHDMFCSCGDIS